MQHVVMIVPIDPHIDEAEHIAQENRRERNEHSNAVSLRRLQLQHHNRDDDRNHSIAKRLKPPRPHLYPPTSPLSSTEISATILYGHSTAAPHVRTITVSWLQLVFNATISSQSPPRSPAPAKSPKISATLHETHTPPAPPQNTYSRPRPKTTQPQMQSSPCQSPSADSETLSPPPQKSPTPATHPK